MSEEILGPGTSGFIEEPAAGGETIWPSQPEGSDNTVHILPAAATLTGGTFTFTLPSRRRSTAMGGPTGVPIDKVIERLQRRLKKRRLPTVTIVPAAAIATGGGFTFRRIRPPVVIARATARLTAAPVTWRFDVTDEWLLGLVESEEAMALGLV